jgi:peptidoglycan-associated lipoprotein
MKNLALSCLVLGLLVACANPKPKVEETKPAEAANPPAVETAADKQATVNSANAASAEPAPAVIDPSDPLNAPNSLLTKRSIYYALDAYVVEDAFKPIIQAHAKYLSEHPQRKVHVEGNADERGSNEYNLALGQRRADGVKQMLILGGAKDSQIEATSFGEEKPKATGHDEASWSQNRRVDLSY